MSVFDYIKQLGAETIIYGLSGAITASIGIFLIPIYTRIFSPSEYGIIALITTLTGLLGMLMVLGLDNSSARWFYDTDDIEDRKYTISSWFWCQLSTGFIIAISLLLFAPNIAILLLNSEDYAILIRIVAITLPFGTFGKVFGNWLRYQRRAWTTTIFSTISSIGTIGIIILFVLVYRWGLTGIYSAKLIAAIIAAIGAITIMKTWINPVFFSMPRLKEMLTFGLPLVPAAIASWITLSSDRFILQIFHDTSEVGLYSVAATLASGVALVTVAFQMAWGPFAFSIYREKESLNVYSQVLNLYAFLGCLLCTTLSLFAPFLLHILTTPDYYKSASCVSFLVFSYLAAGATYIMATGVSIAKKSTPIAVSIFIGAGVNIGLNFLLIPSIGKEGAAISTFIAYISASIYLYFSSQKVYPIPYQFKKALICFGLSWILIAIDYFFFPAREYSALKLRTGISLLFIPLAFWLRIIKPVHAKRLLLYAAQRLKISDV